MSIGKKILELRKRLGLSQEQMAKDLHVSRQTISKWESDLSLPDMNTILLMSELYQVKVTDLLGIDENKDNSIHQLYEQMNYVSQNIDKGNKRRMIFDVVLIGICVLSLFFNVFSIFVLLRRSNNPIIVRHTNPEQVVEEDSIVIASHLKVLKYHFDDMTMDINIHCSVNTKYTDGQVSCYLKDRNDKEYNYKMENIKNNEYEYNGVIPIQNYEKVLIEIKYDEQSLIEDLTYLSAEDYLDNVLRNYVELFIPFERTKNYGKKMLWDKLEYVIPYSHVDEKGYGYSFNKDIDPKDLGIKDIRCDGQINGVLKLKIINNKTKEVHFDKSIDLKKPGRYDTLVPFENNEDMSLTGTIVVNGHEVEINESLKLVDRYSSMEPIELYGELYSWS